MKYVYFSEEELLYKIKTFGGEVVKSFADEVLDNEKLMYEAIKTYPYALDYASKRLQNDKDFVIKAVQYYPRALHYASEELQDNIIIVTEAVKRDGISLRFASERLRDDKKTVLVAVKNNGLALEEASKTLQDDYDVVKEAVKSKPLALEYASEEQRDNLEIVLAAMLKDESVFDYASSRLYYNRAIRNASKETLKQWYAICKDPKNFAMLDRDFFLRKNRRYLEVAIEAVKEQLKKLPDTEENRAYIQNMIKFIKEITESKKLKVKEERKRQKIQQNYEKEIDRGLDDIIK